MYDLGCMLDYSRFFVMLDGLLGLYGLKYDSATALVVVIVLVLLYISQFCHITDRLAPPKANVSVGRGRGRIG